MSNCCFQDSDVASALPKSKPGFCPGCGQKAKAVSALTVKNLARDHSRVPAKASFSFCRTADCDVVYFANEAVFHKPDVKVRVGIKENDDPIPLCYCFDYTREDVRRDIQAVGDTKILERIKSEVQSGFCGCEVKNPSGACCLGDITRAVQDAKKDAAQSAPAPR